MAEVAADGRHVTPVAVTLRTAAFRTGTFWTGTKVATLRAGPTGGAAAVAAMAVEVLGRFARDRPVRLAGVRVVLLDPVSPATPP